MLSYRVIIEKDEDGVLVGRVPGLPGCATEGKMGSEPRFETSIFPIFLGWYSLEERALNVNLNNFSWILTL